MANRTSVSRKTALFEQRGYLAEHQNEIMHTMGMG
jgi:hypothetical protein